MKYRPDNWGSIAGKGYTVSNEYVQARRGINTLLTSRLLEVGLCVLSNRWEEDIVRGEVVWKSTIYPEDYMEAGGNSLKNTLAVFRENYTKLLECWVEFEDTRYNIITSCELENGIITIYWNPSIIRHIAARSMLLSRFSGA